MRYLTLVKGSGLTADEMADITEAIKRIREGDSFVVVNIPVDIAITFQQVPDDF